MTQGGPGIIISKSDGVETAVHDLLTTRYGVSNQRVVAAAVAACHQHIAEARAQGRAEVLEEARTTVADLRREIAGKIRQCCAMPEDPLFQLADELCPLEPGVTDGDAG